MNSFTFIEIAVPLLAAVWVFRELWALFLRAAPIQANGEPDQTPDLPTQPIDRADFVWPIVIALGFYLLAIWRLGTPNQQYFDEIYHARSGMEYVMGENPHEWTHPPLAKLLIALSLRAWGVQFASSDAGWNQDAHYTFHQAFAWRYPSVVFGAGALVMIFALGRAMFRNRTVAVSAALLLACDGVFFVQSRIAMTNTFTVFFVLASVLGTWQFFERRDPRWLLLTGLGLGLALATRWSTLWAWGMTGLALLWHLSSALFPEWKRRGAIVRPLLVWTGMAALSMILIPVVIYTLSFLPFVLQGPGDAAFKLFHKDANFHGWQKVWELQHDMWAYHSGIKEKHPYSSPWWSWPLTLRPTWYYFNRDANGLVRGVWSIGNAAIWWASVPAFLTCTLLAYREKRLALGLVALFGLGQWLPWGIEPRSLIFMHYYYESIPFACLGLAYLCGRLWFSGDEGKRSLAACYAVLVAAWFIFYYPVLAAYPIRERYYEAHLWLGRPWI